MQRKDIKTGELLAYRKDQSGPLMAALVLDTSTLWERESTRQGGVKWTRAKATRSGTRGGYAGYGYASWGLLAAVADTSYDRTERDQRAEALTQWMSMVDDPQDLTTESVAALEKSTPEGVRLQVIDGRTLRGTWGLTTRTQDRREDAEAADRARERAERERLTAVYDRALIAWRERFPESGFGFDAYSHGALNARVPLEDLAVLLGVDPK
jgi:hypothetical protein